VNTAPEVSITAVKSFILQVTDESPLIFFILLNFFINLIKKFKNILAALPDLIIVRLFIQRYP